MEHVLVWSSPEREFCIPIAVLSRQRLGCPSPAGGDNMAASLFVILIFLTCQLSGTGVSALPLEAPLFPDGPHFTHCLSREQETFRCWWTAGSFQNLSEPGALRVFFKKSQSGDWTECPEYSAHVPNECYFNKTHTSVWTRYDLQLRSQAQNITYHNHRFSVEDIVHPDPPIRLNWTLLNVSRSGLHFDVIVRWEPPPSADVKTGWMTLVYEMHYRERNTSRWNMMDQETGTHQSIYGLHTGTEYEVRVRCKMRLSDNFGDFSETILVFSSSIPTKGSPFPVTLVLVFGAVGVGVLLVLIIFSQQQKLMVILLPPVPAPKIKGIDPELLKKGKLDELSSILSSHHMYQPELFQEDSWVEFIELDMGEAGDKSEAESDTQRLLSSSHGLCIKDDDSGRASCYDPELPDPDPLALQKRGAPPVIPAPAPPPPLARTWVNMDFYAQVSDVTPTGGVVLSPGQQGGAPQDAKEEKVKKSWKEEEEEEEEKEREEEEEDKEGESEKKKKLSFQLLVVDPEGGAYTSERDARQISAEFCPAQGYTSVPPQPPTFRVPVGGFQSPYMLVEVPPCPPLPLPPVSDYTVVQDVDAQHHSLLLNPTPPAPHTQPHPHQAPPSHARGVPDP
ncbi:hypothetical protein AAFF_G00066160 [Aldrovandia affinis]|uniref:Fibronectin type-III domain-containing protein n=1 Tax=Aldrovandia affinis TaxID=143900 RepID=A0AAD7T4W9_9TELE|nr:hypothetical protein AAFF_G00066160 [Aldrovandia affinis]